jgi:hypothetical protein
MTANKTLQILPTLRRQVADKTLGARHLFTSTLCLTATALSSCGGESAPSFAGTWSGSFTTRSNGCPFSVAEDINPLFPMTVTVDEADIFTVVAVNGDTAAGKQGDGETVSFLASSAQFGRYGSITPYSCKKVVSELGYLSVGTDLARVILTVQFTECTTSADPQKRATSCAATYFGEATRVRAG